jgi:hypothetical protein
MELVVVKGWPERQQLHHVDYQRQQVFGDVLGPQALMGSTWPLIQAEEDYDSWAGAGW